MNHTGTENESREAAALYALGALGQHEARSFEEHLEEGCAACAAELAEFERVVEGLSLSAGPAEPPAHAREKLLARVGVETEAGPGGNGHTASLPQSPGALDFLVVRAGAGEWVETHDRGVFVKVLFVDKERDTVTTLVRMEPGACVPRHRHRGVEQCLVLEGDVSSGGHAMGAGDFNCSLRGSVHDELTTDGGALLFIVAPESYEVLEQGGNLPRL